MGGRHSTRGGGWLLLLVAVLAIALGTGGYLGSWQWREHHPGAQPQPSTSPPASALAQALVPPPSDTAHPGPVPDIANLAAALRLPLADPRLGARTLVKIRDASTGAVLLDHGGSTPSAPASTAKVATAIAVLTARNATDRITTRVVQGAQPGTVVLVGAGDPTLSAAPAGANPDAARVADLAAQLRGKNVSRILVDGSAYSGPAESPAWAPEDIPSDYAAPITAAMVDGGRDAPGAAIRSVTPDLAAAHALAAALGSPGLPVGRGTAPPNAQLLASVRSASIGTLVAQMLSASDNVIAETLARQVAIAERRPASFSGAAAAVRQVLLGLGVDIGAGMLDGSGLAAADRLTPDALTQVLRLATSDARPALHVVIDDLPVAGWSGTLAGRYSDPPSKAGAGLVRAKTGTLTSVSTLAGVTHDADGRLLVFALMADRVGAEVSDTTAAESALDRVAATLAACGCQ